MKKSLTLFLISLLSLVIGLAVFTGCEGKRPKVEAPVIAENVQTVELGTDDDLAFSVDWKNGTLTEVKKGQTSLTSTNYEVSENSLTIKGDYVATLLEGENLFTLITDGGTADFKIIVTDSRPANPTVTPDKTSAFNTLAPDDLITYTIAWGKGTFSSLKVGEETLEKDTDYTVEGDTLSIVGKGLIDSWDAGTYTFTLTTSTGSATFDLTVVMSGSRYLDQKVFKESNGNDVSFAMLIGTNTSITSVKLGETALTASDYEYSLANEAFTLKSTYLETLPAGIYEFVITLDDETSYVVSVAVGTVFADNFENGNTNGANITFGNGNSNVSGEDAIEGKSVNMDLESPNIAGTLLHVKGITLVPNTLYVLNMTVRIDGKTQLIFTLPAQAGNQAWMNEDGTLSANPDQRVDSRSTATEIEENVYQLKIYLPVTAFDENGVNVNIYFRNGDLSEGAPSVQEHTKLVIDNMFMFENKTETFLPASKATIAPEYQEIPSIQDVNVTVNNNYGTFVSITENDSALLDSDYIIDGNTLTIKADYFTARGMAVGQSFTFTYNTVNPDNNDQTFATTFTVKYNATVWGSVYEKEFDGESDVSFDVSIGEVSGVVVKLGANELTASDFAVSSTAITVKANYLKTLETNKVYQFVMVDSSDNQFRFAIYVGCTAQSVFYADFEDGVLITAENIGVQMSPSIKLDGFDGKSTLVSGSGTIFLVNRPDTPQLNEVVLDIVSGDTYEFSMDFKFTESGKPVAGAANDWGILGGNKNVFLNFMSQNAASKYAWIDVDAEGNLTLVKNECVADKSSLTLNGDVYTLVLTYVANGNVLEVPCWNAATFEMDNIMLRKVPGVPTISGEYTFDKSTNEDVNIPVNMHGSTLTEVKIGDVALTSSDYEISGETLVIKATKLAAYETDTTVSVTIVSNAGTSNAVSIKIADAAPFLTGDSEIVYDPYEDIESIGIDANGKTIKEIKVGDSVVPSTDYTYNESAKTLTFTASYLATLNGVIEHIVTFENTASIVKFNVVTNNPLLSFTFEDGVLPSGENLGIGLTPTLNESGFDGKSVTLSGAGTALYVNRPGYSAPEYVNVPITLGQAYQFKMSFKFTDSGKPVAGASNDYDVLGGNANVVFAFLDTSAVAKYAHIDVDASGELVLVKTYCIENETSLTKDENGVYTLVLTFIAAGSGDFQVPCWNNCTFDIDNIMLRKVINPDRIPNEMSLVNIDFENGALPSGENLGIGLNPILNANGFNGKSATLSGSGTALFINRGGFSGAAYVTAPVVLGQTYQFKMSFKFTDSGKPVAGAGNGYGVFTGNANIVFAILDGAFAGGNYAHIDVDANGDLVLGKLDCVQDKTSLTKDENGVYTLVLTYVATGDTAMQVPCWNSCTFDIDNIALSHIL